MIWIDGKMAKPENASAVGDFMMLCSIHYIPVKTYLEKLFKTYHIKGQM